MRLSAKKRQQLIVEKLLKEGSVNDHELADAFHVSEAKVKTSLFRTRQRLREALDKEGIVI